MPGYMDDPGLEAEADMDFTGEGSLRLNRELTKVGAWALWIVLIGVLPAILLGIGCQAELPGEPPDELPDLPGQPVRELAALVEAGDEFEITVTFASPDDDFHAIGLTEIAPAGWNVTVDVAWTDPQAMLAHTPEPERATYIWEGPYPAGLNFTAVYTVKVPADAESGTYTFSGSLKYYIEPHPAPSYEEEIAGDMQVTVS